MATTTLAANMDIHPERSPLHGSLGGILLLAGLSEFPHNEEKYNGTIYAPVEKAKRT